MTPLLNTLNQVIERHKDEVDTHYESCYMYHAACLALLVKELITEEEYDV